MPVSTRAHERQLLAVAALVERGVKGRVGFYLGRPVVLGADQENGWVEAYDPEEDKTLRFWGDQIKTVPWGRRVQRPIGATAR